MNLWAIFRTMEKRSGRNTMTKRTIFDAKQKLKREWHYWFGKTPYTIQIGDYIQTTDSWMEMKLKLLKSQIAFTIKEGV
jgi:hypothetical protein